MGATPSVVWQPDQVVHNLYRWVLGIALLCAGAVPLMAALLVTTTEANLIPGVLVLVGLAFPALAGGIYLVAGALRTEKRLFRR